MDTQLLLGEDESEGEWAVERIIAHAGSMENVIFQVQWKTGDVTWLPYYQITHLNALPIYLDLLGVEDILKLPKGKGTPPPDNPQIFVSLITLQRALKPHLENSSKPFPAHFIPPAIPCALLEPSCHHQQLTISTRMTDVSTLAPIITNDIVPDTPAAPIVTADTPKNSKETKYSTFTHCCLRCPCLTIITITHPVLKITSFYHVSQVALYCLTNMRLHKQKPPRYGLPAGYEHFTTNFNIWATHSYHLHHVFLTVAVRHLDQLL